MVVSHTVISQVQNFQIILHDIHSEDMSLSESFQVATLMEKVTIDLKDFKNYFDIIYFLVLVTRKLIVF